jgi:spermidine synthase
VTVELLRDLDREGGWLLLVDGSEQSYVDVEHPDHLEFEYVQHFAHVVEAWRPPGQPINAVHLGGGLCTVPRWIAARNPRSRQLVIESSAEIAGLCRSLPLPRGVTLRVGDALDWLAGLDDARARTDPVALVVVDVYAGPETVTAPFTLDALTRLAGRLQPGGLVLANLSDALPFDLARTAAATMRVLWPEVAVVVEPPVLRGRRSGNVVLAATDGTLDHRELVRRCAGGYVRGRVLAATELTDWIADAVPAARADDLPRSGELGVRWLR